MPQSNDFPASSPPPDERRKRLFYRCRHRGSKELDVLLGGFAERHLAALDRDGLAALERLIAEDDRPIYDWIMGYAPAPPDHETPVLALLRKDVKERLIR